MSEIIAHDEWQGRITRVYVWYPTREAGEDWRNDPAIQHVIVPMAESRPGDEDEKYDYLLCGNPYYWHKYARGCVWVIARAAFFKEWHETVSLPSK